MLPGIAAVPLGRMPNIPSITGVSPSNGNSPTVTVNGTADAGAAITLYRAGTSVGTTTASQSTGAWSIAGVALSVGDNSLTATAAFGARVSAVSVSFNARYVPAGSQSYTNPGGLDNSIKFTVPLYNTLTVTVDGGGGGGSNGGGGEQGSWSGGDGGQSKFASSTPVIANGGTGGSTWAAYNDGWQSGANNGTPGTATGGDTNTTGGGSAGGSGNGSGAPGGRSVKTWAFGAAGAPAQGAQIVVVVGAGGPGQGGAVGGVNGKVQVSWS